MSVVANDQNGISTALAAVALQDHLVKSLQLEGLYCAKPSFKSTFSTKTAAQNSSAIVRAKLPHKIKQGPSASSSKVQPDEAEYVLDRKPPSLSLAQKFGLVDVPPSLLTEDQWSGIKGLALLRLDFQLPCVICKEDLGKKDHVLLSCTHVFHKSCLHAFESFTGRKTCPMCRKEQYQTRVVHDGKNFYKHKSATVIQAAWRGYVVRCMYKSMQQLVPPSDLKRRKLFYEEKLKSVTDQLVRSFDNNISHFMSELDRDLEASRKIFCNFDNAVKVINEEQWKDVIAKAFKRDLGDCPICLTALEQLTTKSMNIDNKKSSESTISQSSKSAPVRRQQGSAKNSHCTYPKNHIGKKIKKKSSHSVNTKQDTTLGLARRQLGEGCPYATKQHKPLVVLSCTHTFHQTCLEALEQFASNETRFVCPFCRSYYQKRILDIDSYEF